MLQPASKFPVTFHVFTGTKFSLLVYGQITDSSSCPVANRVLLVGADIARHANLPRGIDRGRIPYSGGGGHLSHSIILSPIQRTTGTAMLFPSILYRGPSAIGLPL